MAGVQQIKVAVRENEPFDFLTQFDCFCQTY